MALKKQSLLTSRTLAQTPRLIPNPGGGTKRVKLSISAGAELLPVGTPIAFNTSTNEWVPYTQPSATVASFTVTNDSGTGTDGGTFELMIDGLGSVHQWDVPIATIQADLDALLIDGGKAYTVVVTGAAHMGTDAQVTTFTFSENAGSPSVSLDGGGLLDGVVPEPESYLLAIVAAGTALNGADKIAGFILEANSADTDANGNEGVLLSATEEVLAVVLHMGEAYRDDINTAAIRTILALFGAPSEAELDAALRDPDLRKDGITIRGLTGVR